LAVGRDPLRQAEVGHVGFAPLVQQEANSVSLISLRATQRFKQAWRALYTMPMPPRPNVSISSYSPSQSLPPRGA